MCVPKTSDHIQMKIKMPNPNQGSSASLKAPNEDLKDMYVLCTFKIKIESTNFEHGSIKDCNHIQIMIKMPNPIQEPPVSSKAPNEDFKDMDVLCTFKIKIQSQNLDHGCIKDQWIYPNEDQDAKPQSGTSGILQTPKLWLKGHGCSLHLQNQVREPKFETWVYQKPVKISK